jgi:hypothetical protein
MSDSFKEALFGTKGKFRTTPTTTPQQQALISQLISGLGAGGGLLGTGLGAIGQQLGGGQEFIEQLQAPALRQFQEQIIPGLAERFSAAGSGAQGSSAFQQALGQAGAGLSEQLAAQRAGLGVQQQQQGLQGLLSLLGLSQQPQFATAFQPGKQGALGGLLGGLGQGIGGALGGLAGGGITSGLGALGGLFGRNDQLQQPQATQFATGQFRR